LPQQAEREKRAARTLREVDFLSIAIDLVDPTASVDLAMNVAHYFALETVQAKKFLRKLARLQPYGTKKLPNTKSKKQK